MEHARIRKGNNKKRGNNKPHLSNVEWAGVVVITTCNIAIIIALSTRNPRLPYSHSTPMLNEKGQPGICFWQKAELWRRVPRFSPVKFPPGIFLTQISRREASSTTRVYRGDLSSCRAIRCVMWRFCHNFRVAITILRDQYEKKLPRSRSVPGRQLASQRRKCSAEELRRVP